MKVRQRESKQLEHSALEKRACTLVGFLRAGRNRHGERDSRQRHRQRRRGRARKTGLHFPKGQLSSIKRGTGVCRR